MSFKLQFYTTLRLPFTTILAQTSDDLEVGPHIRVLVVEDSEDIRTLLEELLEAEGYNLVFATNGEEGLEKAKREHPDIILMDLSLPGMDGWETVYRLRQLAEFKTTPVIALTAHATRKDEERALAAGCTGYISKPFDMENLLNYIASFVTKN
ncbi:MAG: response regulator [Chloroflexi bacterium]|nr:response regulator [Chloroflexota bacterium]